MSDSQKKILDILNDGNKYTLYFLFIILFIHFAIIIPFKHPPKNNEVGQASKTLESQMSYLNSTLTKLENPSTASKLKATSSADISDSLRAEKIYNVRQKLIEYQKAYLDVLKQRAEKSFSLPILGISINESVVLSIYPGFILVGLCLALLYRSRFLLLIQNLSMDDRKGISFPLWSAPIPYSMRSGSLASWLFVNTIGLSIHYLIIYVGLDFLLFQGNVFNFETLAINVFTAIVAIVVYSVTVFQLVQFEWKRQQI